MSKCEITVYKCCKVWYNFTKGDNRIQILWIKYTMGVMQMGRTYDNTLKEKKRRAEYLTTALFWWRNLIGGLERTAR